MELEGSHGQWDPFFMPKKKADRKVPRYGRSEKDISKEMGLHSYTADVPLGNTDPTMVEGKLEGGMPNSSRMARGSLRTQRGKRT